MMDEDAGLDLWGLRAPTRPPERVPPPAAAETSRRLRRLHAEPAVNGCLHDITPTEIQSRGSGATMHYATWRGPVAPALRPLVTTTRDGSYPAIVKLGADARQAHWAALLSAHAPDLVPGVYASGITLDAEPVPWIVMERCPLRLDYGWGHHLYTMVLDACVRFHRATRRLAPPVGPQNVWVDWFCRLVRQCLTSDPPAPGPAAPVVERLAAEWAWVLAVCRVEFAHGDLHLNNAVWRTAPPDPQAQALLIDFAPNPMVWAYEPAYCQVVYWPGGSGHPQYPTLVHEMAALRAAYGLEVPAPADVDRLATLFLAWNALRLWPRVTHRHGLPDYVASVTAWVEAAARLAPPPALRT